MASIISSAVIGSVLRLRRSSRVGRLSGLFVCGNSSRFTIGSGSGFGSGLSSGFGSGFKSDSSLLKTLREASFETRVRNDRTDSRLQYNNQGLNCMHKESLSPSNCPDHEKHRSFVSFGLLQAKTLSIRVAVRFFGLDADRADIRIIGQSERMISVKTLNLLAA